MKERIRTVLTVDIGTSSLKVAIIDSKGKVYAYERVACNLSAPKKHSASIWIEALSIAILNIANKVTKKNQDHINFLNKDEIIPSIEIVAIIVSGNGPTIATDDYLLLWNEEITVNEEILERVKPSLFLPRLLHIKENLPSVWNSAKRFFSGPEYLIYQLCGAETTILTEMRFEAAYWTPEQLEKFDIDTALLPSFVDIGHCAGVLSESAWNFLGFSAMHESGLVQKGIKVLCGAPDFVVALIGTNTLFAGAVCDRAGSSEGINMCTPAPLVGEGLRVLPSVLPNFFNASVLIPHSDDMKNEVKVQQVLQAIQKLEKAAGCKIKKMRVTGGQARNSELNQLKSSALGIPVEVMQLYDAELIGDAILAFHSLGEYASITEAAQEMTFVAETFFP